MADDYTIEDIDEERLRAAVRLGVDAGRISPTANGERVETLLRKFHFFKDGKITNGAVMLFARDTSDYPQLLLRMARFDGNDKNEFIDTQRKKGNFFDLLDAGMEFAYKHLNLGGKIVGLRRDDKLEIPIKALREGLINAYCHRTYDSPSASVSMAIYDDRLEIVNPGRLPNELTVESMMLPHDSFPMNPDIADFMFKTTYLDSWGTGVQRMCDVCKEENVPEPYYIAEQGYVTIVFKKGASATGDCGSNESYGENGSEIQLTERQQAIYNAIKNNIEVTANRMAGTLADTLADTLALSKRTVEREIKFLRDNGYIRKEGKRNKGVWVVLK